MKYDFALHELWFDAPEIELQRDIIKPHGIIGNCVAGFYIIENHKRQQAPTLILPDLSPHLIIYHTTKKTSARIIGPRTYSVFINHHNRIKTFIFRIKPGVISNFTINAISSFKDISVSIDEIWAGSEERIKYLKENISEEEFPYRLIDFLNTLLSKNINYSPSNQKITEAFLNILNRKKGDLNVKDASDEIGVSERYLRKIILNNIGMNPKMAIRIERLTHSLKLRQFHHFYNWTDVAYSSGYFDQSHMIDEYQRLLNYSPTQLFR